MLYVRTTYIDIVTRGKNDKNNVELIACARENPEKENYFEFLRFCLFRNQLHTYYYQFFQKKNYTKRMFD